jgi:hypothetical protein
MLRAITFITTSIAAFILVVVAVYDTTFTGTPPMTIIYSAIGYAVIALISKP